jgi:CBS domain-containing membrane protein
MQFLRFLTIDPVNLSLKGKAYSVIACFCAIFFMALITRILTLGPEYPLIVASMGASAVILFFIPNSPLAQPWPFVGGQLSSAMVGITCALHIDETASAAAAAVGGAVLVMLMLRCLHPPGAATSLAPIMAGDSITSLGYDFVIEPVAINVAFMLFLAIFINRWVMKHNYPSPLPIKELPRQPLQNISAPTHKVGISEEDLNLALKDLDFFVDMTHSDLSNILTHTEMNTFKRIRSNICCADIMIKEVTAVEFGTEVEDAWQIMYKHNLKAMPVIDKAHRVIGIVTWHDFFKFLNLNIYESFQDKFRNFVRRTAKVTTNKPEAVGQIMTSSIVVLPDTAHIVELIPLMSVQGHRQIPIVNAENRLVGMVYQANLIAALYNTTLATHV